MTFHPSGQFSIPITSSQIRIILSPSTSYYPLFRTSYLGLLVLHSLLSTKLMFQLNLYVLIQTTKIILRVMSTYIHTSESANFSSDVVYISSNTQQVRSAQKLPRGGSLTSELDVVEASPVSDKYLSISIVNLRDIE